MLARSYPTAQASGQMCRELAEANANTEKKPQQRQLCTGRAVHYRRKENDKKALSRQKKFGKPEGRPLYHTEELSSSGEADNDGGIQVGRKGCVPSPPARDGNVVPRRLYRRIMRGQLVLRPRSYLWTCCRVGADFMRYAPQH